MTTPTPKSASAGNLSTFNILHGFPEALVRGMRSSFLADADYHHLTQCETLDDVRLNLSETDYQDALADMNTLIPTGLQKAAVEKVSLYLVFCNPPPPTLLFRTKFFGGRRDSLVGICE